MTEVMPYILPYTVYTVQYIIEAQGRAREPRSTINYQPPCDPKDGVEVEQITSMSVYLIAVLQEKVKDEQKKVKDY